MEKKLGRLVYIDNLRLLVIISVIMLHSAVTYSGFGSWYYKETSSLSTFSTVVFGYAMTYTQGYFMGFLFLISGFFIPGSYDKKGFGRFLKDRFVRLGIPTLIFMLLINPFTKYFIQGLNWSTPIHYFIEYYWNYLRSFDFLGESGPLWFALALLIFSCVYACVRLVQGPVVQKTKQKEIRLLHIILLILLISTGAFCIRLIQPIDTSILNMRLSNFSQYIILFITGIYAYRYNWFSTIKNRFRIKGLISLLVGGLIPWTVIMIGGGALTGVYLYKGGMNWESASFALWESFISVGTAILLITIFRDKLNKQNKLVKILSDNSFAVYVFHTPILVYLALMLQAIILPPLVKCLLLITIAIPVCFAITHFVIRRVPLLKKVL